MSTLTLALVACAPRTLPDERFARGAVSVPCCGRADEPVTLTYLGVGGWLIEKGETTLLTAPLFSNPSLLDTGVSPIATDPDRVDANLPAAADDAQAILVGHGHYDHLMDVPWIMQNRATRAVLFANRTSAHQIAPYGLRPTSAEGRVFVVTEEMAGRHDRPGEWLSVSSGLRVMPVLSDHAPHLAGHTLYSGTRVTDMASPPQSANEWLDGQTYAWLIDLLNDDGSVGLRIYYQDAVAAAPYGFAPELDDGVGIDVALIVPATYAEVDWHPEALVENLKPRHVLLGHWEDFFRPPSRESEPVPFTLLPDFMRRLERALPDSVGSDLPRPGTVFRFR